MKPLTNLLLTAALLCLSGCAALESESIVGGAEVEPGSVKYHVSLESPLGLSMCGGAIIGERHVITAAHCVTDGSGNFVSNRIYVVAGTTDLEKKAGAVTNVVEKAYVPRIFSRATVMADIAILQVAKPWNLESNPRLSKVELPNRGVTFAGKDATITGFGYTWMKVIRYGSPVEIGGKPDKKLMYAHANVLSHAECQRNYRVKLVREEELCARLHQSGNPPSGVCSGDSGGPLVYGGDTIIGVVSSSPLGCREDRSPAVYTRVSSFLPFIHDALENKSRYARSRTYFVPKSDPFENSAPKLKPFPQFWPFH